MQKIISNIAKTNHKNILSLSDFNAIRKEDNSVLIVQIGKQPSTLLKNSLWVGHRNGGMASWLSSLMPHLPHRKFCLYMDQNNYTGSQYMYNYYSDYFSKLFHKAYIGTFIYPRDHICPSQKINLNQVHARDIQNKIKCKKSANSPLVLLDLRNSQSAVKSCLKKQVSPYKNTHYINVPLNDDDFVELFHNKISHLPSNTRFITMCAKGYRSAIGYSMLQLIKKPEWNIYVCKNPLDQIRQQLAKSHRTSKNQQKIENNKIQNSKLVAFS